MQPFSSTRAAAVLVLIAVLLGGMSARVAWLQTANRQRIIRAAQRQQHTVVSTPARRGMIYDANGMALAITVQAMALYVDPAFLRREYLKPPRGLPQLDADLTKIAPLIDRKPKDLISLISSRWDDRYLKLAENLDEQTCAAIRKLDIPGFGLEPMPQRNYPMGSVAAHVLGSVGKDGRGLEGVELKYQSLLAGEDGWKRVEKDARRRPIGVDAEDFTPPSHGQHVVLTLDANIQLIAEQELASACKINAAKRGEVIVMDPHTGHVLAMANWPTFNPQNVGDANANLRRNRCLTDPYEPGSTLKPFIMGPALANRFTRWDEVWPIPGQTWVVNYGRGRRVTDVHHHGPLTSWDVLVKSSNVGMAMLANRMGNANLRKSLTAFSFGSKTSIELPGEHPGLVNPSKKWTRYSTESVAQGYEMMVTPIQLARGFCVYANGGRLVRPTIVKGVLDEQGNIIEQIGSPSTDRYPVVLDPDAALQIRTILSDTVVRGTGTKARSQHWNIFGKTGTAHISDRLGGYNDRRYTSSFLAGAPLEQPRIVVAFIVHEPDPRVAKYGGAVSAPSAGRLIERTLAYLQAPPSPALPPPPAHIAQRLVNFNPRLYTQPHASVDH